jgi:uncharacterized repeat protein (TIGR03803 family)
MRCGKVPHVVLKAALYFSVLLALTMPGSAASFKVIYTFQSSGSQDAALPEGQLIRDAKGDLYGTTVAGGAYGGGTVFELSPNADGTWSETILYSFTDGSDGGLPVAGLVFDDDGNLYGAAQQGGTFNHRCPGGCGVIFELSPSEGGWTYILLHTFSGSGDGAGPAGTPVLDAKGNLYGTTGGGGFFGNQCNGGCGVAFELVRSAGWGEKILHTFLNYPQDGAWPAGGLVFDANENAFGTTVIGGLGGGGNGASGTVYELTPTTKGPWTETILHSFCSQFFCADGNGPTGAPVLQNGGIFGATFNGGTVGAYGTVFNLVDTANGWHMREFSFDGTDGQVPIAPVVVRNGKIYGVTQQGGIVNGACSLYPYGNGVVYELVSQGSALTENVLYSFTGGSDGCGPSAGLVADPAGNLYGTTLQGGGSNNAGVVFEITP